MLTISYQRTKLLKLLKPLKRRPAHHFLFDCCRRCVLFPTSTRSSRIPVLLRFVYRRYVFDRACVRRSHVDLSVTAISTALWLSLENSGLA